MVLTQAETDKVIFLLIKKVQYSWGVAIQTMTTKVCTLVNVINCGNFGAQL